MFVPFLAASFVSLAVRYRTGSWLLRQQVKWLVLTAGAFLASMLLALLSTWAGQPGLNSVANAVSAVIPLFGIPAAIAVASSSTSSTTSTGSSAGPCPTPS